VSYERHCRNCGAVNAVEDRERCDGCGRLISREESLQTVVLHASGDRFRSQNGIGLCPECFAKVHVPMWPCANCGHPRHMHNAGCMVLLGPRPDGVGNFCCGCSAFVPPPLDGGAP
jgi:hypothetical protein